MTLHELHAWRKRLGAKTKQVRSGLGQSLRRHTKDLVDFGAIEAFLSSLEKKQIKISTFKRYIANASLVLTWVLAQLPTRRRCLEAQEVTSG